MSPLVFDASFLTPRTSFLPLSLALVSRLPPLLSLNSFTYFRLQKETITHTVASVTMGEVGWYLSQPHKKTSLRLAVSGKMRLQMLAQDATVTHSSVLWENGTARKS